MVLSASIWAIESIALPIDVAAVPAVIPTVASHTLITAEHTNYLLTQINAGLWHIEEDVSFLQVKRSSSTSISATLYNQLEDVYNNTIEPKKFNIDPSSKNVNKIAIIMTFEKN